MYLVIAALLVQESGTGEYLRWLLNVCWSPGVFYLCGKFASRQGRCDVLAGSFRHCPCLSSDGLPGADHRRRGRTHSHFDSAHLSTYSSPQLSRSASRIRCQTMPCSNLGWSDSSQRQPRETQPAPCPASSTEGRLITIAQHWQDDDLRPKFVTYRRCSSSTECQLRTEHQVKLVHYVLLPCLTQNEPRDLHIVSRKFKAASDRGPPHRESHMNHTVRIQAPVPRLWCRLPYWQRAQALPGPT